MMAMYGLALTIPVALLLTLATLDLHWLAQQAVNVRLVEIGVAQTLHVHVSIVKTHTIFFHAVFVDSVQ